MNVLYAFHFAYGMIQFVYAMMALHNNRTYLRRNLYKMREIEMRVCFFSSSFLFHFSFCCNCITKYYIEKYEIGWIDKVKSVD